MRAVPSRTNRPFSQWLHRRPVQPEYPRWSDRHAHASSRSDLRQACWLRAKVPRLDHTRWRFHDDEGVANGLDLDLARFCFEAVVAVPFRECGEQQNGDPCTGDCGFKNERLVWFI